MGGKSSDIFYCPLLNRVMVLLNCAESNGAILRSALKRRGYSPSKLGDKLEPFLLLLCTRAGLKG